MNEVVSLQGTDEGITATVKKTLEAIEAGSLGKKVLLQFADN